MVLMIDNYDSFTYNLYQLAAEIEPDIKVVRNDEITVGDIRKMNPSHIIISPGPCYPHQAGICEQVIEEFKDEYKIFGVCLGHQAICEVMGATIGRADKLMHGKQSLININNQNPIFIGLDKEIKAARYHSLVAKREGFPDTLEVIATGPDNEVMAVQVKGKQVFGVQFHPESILTPNGKPILENFLKL